MADFLPLNVDDNYAVSDNNTGYIASGNNTATTSNPIQGDIRFRKDPISSIGASLNNATSYDNSALEVLTRTSKSDGFVRISDDFNGANSSVSGNLSGYSKRPYPNSACKNTGIRTAELVRIWETYFLAAEIIFTECTL